MGVRSRDQAALQSTTAPLVSTSIESVFIRAPTILAEAVVPSRRAASAMGIVAQFTEWTAPGQRHPALPGQQPPAAVLLHGLDGQDLGGHSGGASMRAARSEAF